LCFERALIAQRFFDGQWPRTANNRSPNAVVNRWNMKQLIVVTNDD
jgi:hypothetical protein